MGKYYILLILSFFSLSILAHNVINVRGMQEGQNIVLLYDLQVDTRISQVYVEIDGKSRLIPNACLSGDVNRIVAKGQNHRIVYDVLSDYTNGLKADRIAFVINSNSDGEHKYVDLGLSVKWATSNVGANSPEEYGDYFAWGETQSKSTYNWSTYKWCNGSNSTQTKYCTNSIYGFVDNKTTLDVSDDAARANWGGNWRMPTKEEQDELRNNCTWNWTTQNGVNGYKVMSNINGNSIFLPAAGWCKDSSLNDVGRAGHYWSSSLNTDFLDCAYDLGCTSGDVNSDFSYRRCGLPVRPVCH